MIENLILPLAPPVVAVALALISRRICFSLLVGVFLGHGIYAGSFFEAFQNGMLGLVDVFKSRGNTSVILFCALVGGLCSLLEASGGVAGFVSVLQRRKLAQTKRGAGLVAFVCGLGVFIESSITCLIAGTVARPLAKKHGLSPAKLAYICDATSAPVCMMIPLNAWGAYVLVLLAQGGVENPLTTLASALPLNVYAWGSVIFAAVIAWFSCDFGPMRKAELAYAEQTSKHVENIEDSQISETASRSPWLFFAPILVMLAMIPFGIYQTGKTALAADGKLSGASFFDFVSAGSGSTAVLWAVSLALVVAAALVFFTRAMPKSEIGPTVARGVANLLPMVVLMTLAFALGDVCKLLGTGAKLAALLGPALPAFLLPAVIFVLSGFIAFSTGTSFGTFALMVPLALPLAQTLGIPVPLALAGVLGGGVFGDHCSPLSDTTLIAALSADCDSVTHVTTQLPYALTVAAATVIFYAVYGLVTLGV